MLCNFLRGISENHKDFDIRETIYWRELMDFLTTQASTSVKICYYPYKIQPRIAQELVKEGLFVFDQRNELGTSISWEDGVTPGYQVVEGTLPR